ncbi:hypothetical protein [Halococcoides cellulosivorans]|uniref:hypothetical protein n=1 Tax=Halococcoides cellulosivorans TaxID=1679096 RepID=UPI00131F11A9|nr:hypothetical protein [Halococcoides cellulosivorans]
MSVTSGRTDPNPRFGQHGPNCDELRRRESPRRFCNSLPVYNHRHEQRKKRPRASHGDSVDAPSGDGDSVDAPSGDGDSVDGPGGDGDSVEALDGDGDSTDAFDGGGDGVLALVG